MDHNSLGFGLCPRRTRFQCRNSGIWQFFRLVLRRLSSLNRAFQCRACRRIFLLVAAFSAERISLKMRVLFLWAGRCFLRSLPRLDCEVAAGLSWFCGCIGCRGSCTPPSRGSSTLVRFPPQRPILLLS